MPSSASPLLGLLIFEHAKEKNKVKSRCMVLFLYETEPYIWSPAGLLAWSPPAWFPTWKGVVLLVNQSSVGCEVRYTDGCSLCEVQSIRQLVNTVLSSYSKLCVTSGLRGCGEHTVSCLKTQKLSPAAGMCLSEHRMSPTQRLFYLHCSDFLSNGLHHSGHIRTRCVRQSWLPGEGSRADVRFHRVHTAGVDLDQHLHHGGTEGGRKSENYNLWDISKCSEEQKLEEFVGVPS